MANPVLGKSLRSDCFFLGQDFAVWTVCMETVKPVYFCFGAKPANSKFASKAAKKKRFPKRFLLSWRSGNFWCRSRVPYNKPLTNRACSGRTGEYWPQVVTVRTERILCNSYCSGFLAHNLLKKDAKFRKPCLIPQLNLFYSKHNFMVLTFCQENKSCHNSS